MTAWTNGDAEILSNARNVGSRLVRGEGVRSAHGNPLSRCGSQPGGEMLSVDLDCPGLCQLVGASGRRAGLLGRGKARVAVCKAAFSLRKVVLATRKEDNYC